MNTSELNEKFSLSGILDISEKHSNFPFININNQHASAVISLYGGQVLSYKRNAHAELLFLSDKAFYEAGKAIKGGVPICWPWFGADPEGKGRPAHGFARNTLWQLESTEQLSNGDTKVVIIIESGEQTKSLFAYDFKLSLTVIVGETLKLELTTKNLGQQAFNITQAMHTYLSVKDIGDVSVEGLDKKAYLDKAKSNTGDENKVQAGDILINGEVDRVYLDVPGQLMLKQKAASHNVTIKSKNNKTAVVWNPWQALCEQSADLKADDYRRFVCVETANAVSDVIDVMPGKTFSLLAEYKNS